MSVSLKDRGAIFGGGRAPTTAVWYDVPRGDWVTSTAFARELPWWARTSPLAKLSAEWTLEDGEWVRAHAATPDDAPGEGNYGGLGTTFPHPVGRAKEPNVAFRASPMANEAVLGLALAALRETKNTKDPILLAISLSANDYVGHVFGPDSWEAWDELHRLDASLARFFRELDGQFGENGWAAVLAADHGVTRMPEAMSAERILAHCGTKDSRWHRPCEPGLRILPDPLGPELDRVAARALGAGHWVSGVADPYVYLTDAAKQLPEAKRRALDEALTRALLAKPGIKSVYNARDTSQATCPPQTDESEAALVCRSIPAGVPGELYVVAREGGFFDPSVVVGKGASHGAPYISDRTVPLFARAPGVIAAGDVLETAGFELFARTASELLGLQIPPAARTVPTLLSNLPKKGGE